MPQVRPGPGKLGTIGSLVMPYLTLIKKIEAAMAADLSGPLASEYIKLCPMTKLSNCRPSDLMDSGKAWLRSADK